MAVPTQSPHKPEPKPEPKPAQPKPGERRTNDDDVEGPGRERPLQEQR
jgi:hypothetical protein